MKNLQNNMYNSELGHRSLLCRLRCVRAGKMRRPPVIDCSRTHIINENLLRESDKLLLMCDRSSSVYPLRWMSSSLLSVCRDWGDRLNLSAVRERLSRFRRGELIASWNTRTRIFGTETFQAFKWHRAGPPLKRAGWIFMMTPAEQWHEQEKRPEINVHNQLQNTHH